MNGGIQRKSAQRILSRKTSLQSGNGALCQKRRDDVISLVDLATAAGPNYWAATINYKGS